MGVGDTASWHGIIEIEEMADAATNPVVILERTGWEIRLDPKTWASILLFLEDNGWVPTEQTRTAYYVGSTDVSKLDADSMADYGERVLHVTLNNPAKFYPVSVNMEKFAEFIKFCKEGYFRIRWEAP